MIEEFTVYGIRTGLIREGDDIPAILAEATGHSGAGEFREGDVLVIAETAVATAEGYVISLDSITPGPESVEMARKYDMDPRLVEVVRSESDSIVGGIRGFLLCMKNGTLLPNAGIDESNAPPGCVIPLPPRPDESARNIREQIFSLCGVHIAVIIADSRTHAMRMGCSGVAIGCSGIPSVVDDRGMCDLFGRELEVTKQALADNIASAAEIVMGEADECTPAAIIRGLGLPVGDQEGIETIDAEECLFMGLITRNRDEREIS
ncbi:MAG TPA: coenzyme F420-0:L-glutamate ligase [Methanoregulaceae archaeon]|nr:coenzyme F420-0:L-glutamate ligase [Methanoregulaceae archaeon]